MGRRIGRNDTNSVFNTAIALFMPQIRVNKKDIKIVREDKGKISCLIKCTNLVDFTTDLYTIVLMEAVA